jgi:hypothetical protein
VIPTAPSRGSYLTDGTHLYRELGSLDDVGPAMLLIEDCYSLNILLVTAAQRAELAPVRPDRSKRRRPVPVGAVQPG